MSFVISQIMPAEIPELLTLICELARFERLGHEVEATVGSLHDSFFGPQPVAGALLARQGDELAGYAIYFFTFSSFVAAAGSGWMMFMCGWLFGGRAWAVPCSSGSPAWPRSAAAAVLKWSVLRWNQNALQFYADLGAKALDEWIMFRMNEQAIKRLANFRASPPGSQA